MMHRSLQNLGDPSYDFICMALYSLYCAEVPLRNYSLTHDLGEYQPHLIFEIWKQSIYLGGLGECVKYHCLLLSFLPFLFYFSFISTRVQTTMDD